MNSPTRKLLETHECRLKETMEGIRVVSEQSGTVASNCKTLPRGIPARVALMRLPNPPIWMKVRKCPPNGMPQFLARTRCKCKGNCHSNCPARKYECPNTALDPPRLRLCISCKCSVEACTCGARRPHGVWNFAQNFGFCRGHYPEKPKK